MNHEEEGRGMIVFGVILLSGVFMAGMVAGIVLSCLWGFEA